jgi:hypothetical protein
MPQPDSSRDPTIDARWKESSSAWPVDPAAPDRLPARTGGRPVRRPAEPDKPEQDGRMPHDPDGNEELQREVEDEEEPASRRVHTERHVAYGDVAYGDVAYGDVAHGDATYGTTPLSRWEFETEDTGEWVATERFTLDDEIDDTWPNVPARFLDD